MRIIKGNQIIAIDRLAPAKRLGLYIGWTVDGKTNMYKVATFTGDISAQEFEKVLRHFLEEDNKDDSTN